MRGLEWGDMGLDGAGWGGIGMDRAGWGWILTLFEVELKEFEYEQYIFS